MIPVDYPEDNRGAGTDGDPGFCGLRLAGTGRGRQHVGGKRGKLVSTVFLGSAVLRTAVLPVGSGHRTLKR